MTPDQLTEQPIHSIRAAVLDLMGGRVAGSPLQDDAAFHAALGDIVAQSRDRAMELWRLYRGELPDARARLYARAID